MADPYNLVAGHQYDGGYGINRRDPYGVNASAHGVNYGIDRADPYGLNVSNRSADATLTSLQGGLLTSQATLEIHSKMMEILNIQYEILEDDRKQIRGIIQDCRTETKQLIGLRLEYFRDVHNKIRAGTAVPADVQNFQSWGNAIKELIEALFSHAERSIALINQQDQLGKCERAITLLFSARMTEIHLVAEQAQILRDQQNHELGIELTKRVQKLNEEKEMFGLFLQHAQFASKEKYRAFEMQLQSEVFAHQKDIDYRKQSLQEKNAKRENRLKNKEVDLGFAQKKLEEENRAQLKRQEIKSQELIALRKMSCEERVAMMNAVKGIIAPGENLQSLGVSCTLF